MKARSPANDLVMASCHAPALLDFVEAPFDQVSSPVKIPIQAKCLFDITRVLMPRVALVLIEALWVALGAVWLAGALVATKPERREPLATRLGHSAILLAGFGLVFSPQTSVGLLGWRPIPPAFAWFGAAATCAGAGLALWARLRLGRNWSGAANLGRDHELIQSGPYAFVRHPIYAGLLLALLGTAIAIGEVRGFVGLGLVLAGFWWKSRLEEKLLIQRFGACYLAYRDRVRASLVPYLI